MSNSYKHNESIKLGNNWLQCASNITKCLLVGHCSHTSYSTSVIECEKKMMEIRRFTKFVADLDPGHCSLGAEGSNMHIVEVTP